MKKTIITHQYLHKNYQDLIDRGKFDIDFIFLIILSSAVCTLGFKMNSSSVIIGSMVISPLLYSSILLGSSIYWKDNKSFLQGIKALFIGSFIAICTASIISYFFPTIYLSEIIERIKTSPLDYFFVAVFTGMGGSFAYYWPKISEAITGISISVALIPPIVISGIAINHLDSALLYTSILIIFLNIIGIIISTYLVTAALNWYAKK